jgi:Arc/MetJ-type ribon-helix-helix transcriptional regulator
MRQALIEAEQSGTSDRTMDDIKAAARERHAKPHNASIDGDGNGPGEPFDREAFQAEMRTKHVRPD